MWSFLAYASLWLLPILGLFLLGRYFARRAERPGHGGRGLAVLFYVLAGGLAVSNIAATAYVLWHGGD